MRHVLTFFLVAAIAVGGALWIAQLQGHVALEVAGTTLSAPAPWAVVAVLVFGLLLFLLYRLGAMLLGMGGAIRRRGQGRSRSRGEAAVTDALVALAAREPEEARREAARARRYLGDTPQTLLVTAYAASLAGDKKEAEAAFAALAENRQGAFLGYRGLLRQAVDAQDWERAAELAREAEKSHPGTNFLSQERTHLAVRTGNWREALEINRGREPHAALAAAAAEHETDPDAARKLAKEAWKRDPLLAPAAIAYARRLREQGRERVAQDVLKRSFAANPHPEIAAFALAATQDREARLKLGRDLVSGAPDSGEAHLLIGQLSLDAGHAAEAHRHAELALKAGLAQRRTYLLLADSAEAMGSDEVHRAAHLEALRQAAAAEPDPAWTCEACGSPQDGWRPACPVCHTPGRIRWVVPSAQRRMAAALLEPADALPLDPGRA